MHSSEECSVDVSIHAWQFSLGLKSTVWLCINEMDAKTTKKMNIVVSTDIRGKFFMFLIYTTFSVISKLLVGWLKKI